MPPSSQNIFDIGAALKAIDTQRAAINANWNGQGPDLMTPAQLKGLLAASFALHQASGSLLAAVSANIGRVGVAIK
jgi:hypothetical protein